MNRLRLDLTTRLGQKNQLKRLLRDLTIGALVLSGIFASLQTTEDPQQCTSCTYVIDGVDNSTLNLTGGEVICITASGEFTGTINRWSGSGEVIICNEGVFDPNQINFNSGTNRINNYGIATPQTININGGDSTIIINYADALFEPGNFNLRRSSSVFHNYGIFHPTNLVMDNHSTLHNHESGEASLSNLDMNDVTLINEGTIDMDKKQIRLNNSSIVQNYGIIENMQHLTLNGSSEFENRGSVQVEQHITLNSGLLNYGLMQSGGKLTINGAGSIYNEGGIRVGTDLTINSSISGPSAGNYGWIEASGKTTLNGGGTISGRMDLCDAGNPSGGIDKFYGSVGSEVTFCENNGAVTMPVEYLDISVELQGKQVVVNWITAVEQNNDYFTIERSTDGRVFESLGSVPGAGTTQSMQIYRFEDGLPLPGRNYYRIKQTDFDGASAYSNLMEISTEELSNQLESSLYPNPTDGPAELQLRSPLDFEGELQVLDLNGRILMTRTVSIQTGNNKLSIDIGAMPAGMYFVNLRNPMALPFEALRIIKRG